MAKIDSLTKSWLRNAADERAASRGCRFDAARGQHVIDFAADNLCLYEGEFAGQPLIARDWQIEATMRLYGWVRWSERLGRWVRRFRNASIWIPKKNKKSPTLAWWGLYQLCGDGEMGAKVFFLSKDGKQVRENSVRHAVEMCEGSPILAAECAINKVEQRILHLPTRSILQALTGCNVKTQQSKEGLNGDLMCDETHVVDREFVSVVSRAGISRSEPVFIRVSTVGDDPESYGREDWERGTKIEQGEIDDDATLFMFWGAPQDLSDGDLAADPEKWGKLANPAWGHTIDRDEFVADFRRSAASPRELSKFKKYRLNIWQNSASPWISSADWAACLGEFWLSDLKGQRCYLGLDLAKTRDTSALAYLFPPTDEHPWRISVQYWLPFARAKELAEKVRYQEWADEEWIVLTEGTSCDYAFIRAAVRQAFEEFDVQMLSYDEKYAEPHTDWLINHDGLDEDRFFRFPQTIMHFAGPTAAFERLVIDHQLEHDGNPVLAWQVGNTQVKEDVNANMRPVKPKNGLIQTIDGVVAGIMGLGPGLEDDDGPSVYEGRGMGL